MPNQRHPEKRNITVALPDGLIDSLDAYCSETNLTRAQALAKLVGREIGSDPEEIERVMGWNSNTPPRAKPSKKPRKSNK